MHTAKHKHSRHNHFDFYTDLAKIRSAFADTAGDVKGKAGEVLTQSLEKIKDKSISLRGSVADYTAQKPFKSLGIALLLGTIVGYFLKK